MVKIGEITSGSHDETNMDLIVSLKTITWDTSEVIRMIGILLVVIIIFWVLFSLLKPSTSGSLSPTNKRGVEIDKNNNNKNNNNKKKNE